MFFSRAHLAAAIMPSVPRRPKPPGTRMPLRRFDARQPHARNQDEGEEKGAHLAVQTACHAAWNSCGRSCCASASRSEASTQVIWSLRPHCIDACSSDLTTDVYESCSDVYLPTRQIDTVSNRRSYLRKRDSCQSCFFRIGTVEANARDGELLPHGQQLAAASLATIARRNLVEAEAVLEEADEPLVLEQERDVVQGRHVVDGEDLLVGDVAEHGDLGGDGRGQGVRAAAGNL